MDIEIAMGIAMERMRMNFSKKLTNTVYENLFVLYFYPFTLDMFPLHPGMPILPQWTPCNNLNL